MTFLSASVFISARWEFYYLTFFAFRGLVLVCRMLQAVCKFRLSLVRLASSSALKNDLASIVGDGNVSTTEAVREQHGRDEGPFSSVPADVVVWPQSTQQVSDVAKYCYEHNVPMVPKGTGTGLEGGVHALKGGVCIDVTKMDQVVSFNPEDFDITVQPGITRTSLNHYVKDHGLWFPVDPGAHASLCGMCSTGASGTNAVKYGTMKTNVMNMEVVLPDGRVLYTAGEGRRARKSAAGYNLTNLFVGSEGTLGIVTNATLRLYAIPEITVSAVCSFPSVDAAITSTVQTLQNSIPIARIEFLDALSMRACNNYSKLSYAEAPTLFLEFHGSTAETESQVQMVKEIVGENGCDNFQWTSSTEERNKLWKARHDFLYASLGLQPGCKAVLTDLCVPISNLREIIAYARQVMDEEGVLGTVLGHVGDGNFHCNILFDPQKPEELVHRKKLAEKMGLKALSLNGTCTGEHGIGKGKIGLLEKEYGPVGIDVMRQIKKALDPKLLMNPGKVILM